MIRKRADDGWLMIPQALHAAIAGQFARWWDSPHFMQAEPQKEIEVATALHDCGWAMWDAAPPLREDGVPVDFREIGLAETDAIWEQGISKVVKRSLYAAVLVSHHASTIYEIRSRAGLDSEMITQDRLDMHERARQYLLGKLYESDTYADEFLAPDYLQRAYRILRTCDLLSLALCADELTDGEITDVPTPDGGHVTLTYRLLRPKVLCLSPFPFDSGSMPVIITARHLTQQSFPDLDSYHIALKEAEIHQLYFYLVGESSAE